MAVIRQFTPLPQGRQRPQREAIVGTIVPLRFEGERFLQIYSHGSASREHAGAASQNLRLGKEAFDQLVEIGRKHLSENGN